MSKSIQRPGRHQARHAFSPVKTFPLKKQKGFMKLRIIAKQYELNEQKLNSRPLLIPLKDIENPCFGNSLISSCNLFLILSFVRAHDSLQEDVKRAHWGLSRNHQTLLAFI